MALKNNDPNNTFALFNLTGKGIAVDEHTVQYNPFSGVGISAAMYRPLSGKTGQGKGSIKVFANLQTISISSTRSISPVRVLGSTSPVSYIRGARTAAGTLVFASINTDVFADVYDIALTENLASSESSLIADQMPPFSIVLTAATEKAGLAIQVIRGITLVNYGTTYSIDDIYTETVYSYIATDITPLFNASSKADMAKIRSFISELNFTAGTGGDTLSSVVNNHYKTQMIKYPSPKQLSNAKILEGAVPPKLLPGYRAERINDDYIIYGED